MSSIFFHRFVFRIQEITYANNCVFHYVHKEIDNAFSPGDNYSFHESGLQITLRLLSSSLGNTVLLHSLFLKYETQIAKKKLDNVFQSNCSSHAKLLTKLRKIEKRPKMRHKVVMHPALQMLVINKYMIPCLINLNNWLPRDVRGFSLSWHSSSAVGKKMKKTPDKVQITKSCITHFFKVRVNQGCALRKIEGSPVLRNCKI